MLVPVMRCVLQVLLALSGVARSGGPDPGWVASCDVVYSEAEARALAEELEAILLTDAGWAWIPSWPSLLGNSGWLVFAGPFQSEEEAASAACNLLWRFPDACATYVGCGSRRLRADPAASDLSDLLGVVPLPMALRDFPGIEYPEGWDVERSSVSVDEGVEEWEVPVRLDVSRDDWEISIWMDCYAGPAELRAVLPLEPDDERTGLLYDRFASLAGECSGRLGLDLELCEGVYALLTDPIDSERRLSDRDLWLFVGNGSVEIGYTVRAFYGEGLYCWEHLPEEARAHPFPSMTHVSQAILTVATLASLEELYPWATEGLLRYCVEFMDGRDALAPRSFVDVAIREHHAEGSGLDPRTAPIVDRFRFYPLSGEILWFDVVGAGFTDWEEVLEVRP
ncbi:hypothetical protein JW921_06135 [Candidatus Fermentibacterales bacterium]|nr:hypothetical protein [Candidatus Fermentibacterales bacterium]